MSATHLRKALLPLLLAFASPLHAQAADSQSTVTFAFERPGVQIPKYLLILQEDGTGTYKGEEVTPASRYPGVSTPSAPIDRTLTLSPATTRSIFTLAHDLPTLNDALCGTKIKNLANTGTKTLTLKNQTTESTCTYNYSDNKNITKLTDIFQAITETMDEGRRLDHLHRFDRLGLDAAINFLAQEVSDGRAIEVGTIETTLRALANDTEVLQRVRTRATSLLTLSGTAPPALTHTP